jgi:NAD(P)-dependent dehydrogenase (short-subunit alcohol dehydrogenase family)
MYTGETRLDGKTAVVTGSNTGIGKCTVLDFVMRGEIESEWNIATAFRY